MIAELLSDYITAFISSIGYWGVFILMTLESAALPVPSEVVMPFAGYLSYLGTFNLVLISFVGAAGCATGSVLSYLVGLKGGRPFLEKYGKYFFFELKYLDLAEKWFIKYGDKAVFFSRLLPVVRTFISFPAGIGKYNFKKLVTYSFIGSLPWCFALAYVGYRLGPYWKDIIIFFNGLDIIIIAALILFAIYFLKFRKSLTSD
jgi:membrane protein DedA with SNARE-associated domain